MHIHTAQEKTLLGHQIAPRLIGEKENDGWRRISTQMEVEPGREGCA